MTHDPIMHLRLRAIGGEFRRLRKGRGWTREQMCRRLLDTIGLDLSTQTIATYELGTRTMTIARLVQLCDVFDIRPSAFWSRVEDIVLEPTDPRTITVDLVKIMRTDEPRLTPARVWASNRFVTGETHLVRIPRAAITSLATICHLTPEHLTDIISADPSARVSEVDTDQQPEGAPMTARQIITDARHHIGPECPMSVDLQPADDLIEVVFGSIFGHDRVSLVLHDEDTCDRLVRVVTEARTRLVEHFQKPNPAGATPLPATAAEPAVALVTSH